ncbi:MAG: 2-dehydropantoate 2-reductase [Roseibacillus sp.]
MGIGSIAIVGAGAVGSYYGCRMVQAGYDVRFLLRSDFEEVKRKGFEIQSVAGDFVVESPQIFQSAEEMGPVDLVVLAWKATANENAEAVIAPLLHEESRILTLQNGLGNVELLENLFGRGRVLGGLCFVCINRTAAGTIVHSGGGMVSIGEPSPTGILDEMPDLFGEKVEVRLAADLSEAQWRKLVWNIPFNGLCVAEGGIDTEKLLSLPGKEDEVMMLMKEVQAAASALGHEISDDFLVNQIEITRPMGPYKPSSMLDYVRELPLEVEAIWGEPVRRAEAAGVEVPRMRALYEKIVVLDSAR